MSTRRTDHETHPFGLSDVAASVVLRNESQKTPEERDYRLWKSMLAPYVMKLCIKSAKDLAKKDFFGLSDPYIRVSVVGDDMQAYPHFTAQEEEVYKTSVISKTLHPKWNEDFDFSLSSPVGTVILDLYDKNVLIPDDFLGRVYVTFDLRSIDSQDSFPLDPPEPLPLQLALGEKYQWDLLTRIPHLQNIHNHLSRKLAQNQLKDHKVTGNLNLELSFHNKVLWNDLIERYRSSFDQHDDIHLVQTNRRRSSGVSHLTQSLGGLFSSLIDSVRSRKSTHEDRSDDEGSAGENTDDEDSDNEDPLPDGWEARIDSNRRRMFINHATRSTSLRRPRQSDRPPRLRQLRAFQPRVHSVDEEPSLPSQPSQTSRPPRSSFVRQRSRSIDMDRTGDVASNTESPRQRQSLEEQRPRPRRRSLEENSSSQWESRTTSQGTSYTGFVNLDDVNEPITVTQQTAGPSEQPTEHIVPSAPPLSERPAEYTGGFPSAPPLPTQNETLLESSTGAANHVEPQSQSEALLGNSATTATAPVFLHPGDGLPPGWQSATTADGRVFYIDHSTETTSWVRPSATSQEVHSVVPTAPAAIAVAGIEQDINLPPGWEQRHTPDGRTFYINHNTRTTTWEHPKEHSSSSQEPLPPGWEAGQLPDGRVFYMNHVTKETQWAVPKIDYQAQQSQKPEKIEYDRNYKQKYKNFKASLKPKHSIPNQIELPVKRSSLLETSYDTIMKISDVETLKSRLYVKFEGESGLDYGGLSREWFYLLSHEMFNPYYGLFEYSASDDYTLQINPYSHLCNDNHLSYFKFTGRVCGLAVYHSKLMDAYFIRPFYKMMLKKRIILADMQSVDVEFYNSLLYIIDNDPEPLCLQFSTTKEFLGEITEIDLKPDGRNIPVINSNKIEYVDLMLKWRFVDRVRPQMDAFMEGFSELIPARLLSVFDERELEYLLCGLPAIDVEDWKKYTVYADYKSTDNTIMWFWMVVERFDNETRARLLQFVTGTSKVPMNGFRELQGSNGPKKFTIKRTGNTKSLPVSHTCFNRLDLPPYGSYFTLKEKLILAVENTEGFAIE